MDLVGAIARLWDCQKSASRSEGSRPGGSRDKMTYFCRPSRPCLPEPVKGSACLAPDNAECPFSNISTVAGAGDVSSQQLPLITRKIEFVLGSFFAPKNAKSFVITKFLGSFPLFSIFFGFSCDFPSSAGRFRISLPRSVAALFMG